MSTNDNAARLQANKEVVKRLMSRLFNPETSNTPETRALMTENYIQHNPNFANGPESVMRFPHTQKAREMFGVLKFAGEPLVLAEDDYVMMMQPVHREKGDGSGETFVSFWFDLWRMEDGKAAEHWDYADWDPDLAGKRDA